MKLSIGGVKRLNEVLKTHGQSSPFHEDVKVELDKINEISRDVQAMILALIRDELGHPRSTASAATSGGNTGARVDPPLSKRRLSTTGTPDHQAKRLKVGNADSARHPVPVALPISVESNESSVRPGCHDGPVGSIRVIDLTGDDSAPVSRAAVSSKREMDLPASASDSVLGRKHSIDPKPDAISRAPPSSTHRVMAEDESASSPVAQKKQNFFSGTSTDQAPSSPTLDRQMTEDELCTALSGITLVLPTIVPLDTRMVSLSACSSGEELALAIENRHTALPMWRDKSVAGFVIGSAVRVDRRAVQSSPHRAEHALSVEPDSRPWSKPVAKRM